MSALPSIGRADEAVLGADATHALYERHASRIFAFCFSRLGSREEAEDATQTTFLNAFRSLRGGLVPDFELAWLFRIADNVCRDRRKSAWRRNRVEATRDLEELQDVLAAPEHGSDGLAGLGEALASMPERQRRAILLREWQGLSYGEIAEELGVTRAAVETLIFRARRSLARGLEAPQEVPRRARAGFDVSWLLGLAKSLFQGGAAAKVAASVAVVAGAGFVVATPLRDSARARPQLRPGGPAAAVTTAASQPAARTPSAPAERTRGAGVVGTDGRARPRTHPTTLPAPKARRTPSWPAGKSTPSATEPRPGAGAPPESSTPSPPSSNQEPPAAVEPTSPPLVPSVPDVPLVPEVPTVEPPPLPELPLDVPELPLDAPELPPVPSLP
jgi:RNA polymerase sigma-70 factor (ECF subfamily)